MQCQRGRLLEGCGAAKCTRELCTLKFFILKFLRNFLEVSFESLPVAVSAPLLLQRCQTGTGVIPRACNVFKGLIPGLRAEHTLSEAVSAGILTRESVWSLNHAYPRRTCWRARPAPRLWIRSEAFTVNLCASVQVTFGPELAPTVRCSGLQNNTCKNLPASDQ